LLHIAVNIIQPSHIAIDTLKLELVV